MPPEADMESEFFRSFISLTPKMSFLIIDLLPIKDSGPRF